jgi:hypothetical protein
MKKNVHKHFKTVAKDYACYVLITCREQTDDGQMQVEMTYEGDAFLANYLLQGAQTVIDEACEENYHAPTIRLVK